MKPFKRFPALFPSLPNTALCLSAALFIFLFQLLNSAVAFEIKTDAFKPGGDIPEQYTCDGKDLSPPLHWKNPPQAAKSFALAVDDPDAPMGGWIHWVIYGIPAAVNQLEEGFPQTETLQDGSKQGITDFQKPGYRGPCPPPGKPHRYYFKLYALDTLLDLPPNQTRAKLLESMAGHILAEARLMGRYQRQKIDKTTAVT